MGSTAAPTGRYRTIAIPCRSPRPTGEGASTRPMPARCCSCSRRTQRCICAGWPDPPASGELPRHIFGLLDGEGEKVGMGGRWTCSTSTASRARSSSTFSPSCSSAKVRSSPCSTRFSGEDMTASPRSAPESAPALPSGGVVRNFVRRRSVTTQRCSEWPSSWRSSSPSAGRAPAGGIPGRGLPDLRFTLPRAPRSRHRRYCWSIR